MTADSFTIRTRLILAFGLILSTLILLAITSLYSINTTGQDLNEIYQERLLPLNQMARINDLMRRTIQQLTIATISHGSAEDIQNYLNQAQNNLKEIDNLTRIFFNESMTEEERSLAEDWLKNKDIFIAQGLNPSMAALSSGAFTEAQDTITGIGGQLYKKTQRLTDDLMTLQLETAEQISSDAQKHVSAVHATTIGVLGIVFFFCAVVAYIIRSITGPISRLVGDVNTLAKGEVGHTIYGLNYRDEFGLLAGALEKWRITMIEMHKARDEARARAQQMEVLNASIRTMLDSLGEGIMSFDANGTCSDIFSKACLVFFEVSPASRTFPEVLGMSDENTHKFENLLRLVFVGKKTLALSPQELLDLLPKEFRNSRGMSVSLQYRPILDNAGKIHSVLVVATDRTEQELALQLSRELEAKALMVLRLSAHPNDFKHFFQSITDFFSGEKANFVTDMAVEQLKQEIHSFKGIASLYYLQDLVQALHDLETFLREKPELGLTQPAVKTILSSITVAILKAKVSAEKVLGNDFDKGGMTRIVPLFLLKNLAGELRGISEARDLYNKFVFFVIGEPIHKLLSAFDIGLQELANRYGKDITPCRLTGENFPIFTEAYRTLFATFSHVFRNIIDHAINTPDERKVYGKPPLCSITIETLKFKRDSREWFSISFTDDGAGIDIARLREKLRLQGRDIGGRSDTDIMQCIFEDEVSTRNTVSELSGRGIGLGAVKHEAERLGGTARVESKVNLYTKITIEVPFIWD